MGHVCSRFFTHLPVNTPLQPQIIPPNSFVHRILPVTPTHSIACAQNPAILMKTRNFGGGGRGCHTPHRSRFGTIAIPSSLSCLSLTGVGASIIRSMDAPTPVSDKQLKE